MLGTSEERRPTSLMMDVLATAYPRPHPGVELAKHRHFYPPAIANTNGTGVNGMWRRESARLKNERPQTRLLLGGTLGGEHAAGAGRRL